jgi:hypothetical protein
MKLSVLVLTNARSSFALYAAEISIQPSAAIFAIDVF